MKAHPSSQNGKVRHKMKSLTASTELNSPSFCSCQLEVHLMHCPVPISPKHVATRQSLQGKATLPMSYCNQLSHYVN